MGIIGLLLFDKWLRRICRGELLEDRVMILNLSFGCLEFGEASEGKNPYLGEYSHGSFSESTPSIPAYFQIILANMNFRIHIC